MIGKKVRIDNIDYTIKNIYNTSKYNDCMVMVERDNGRIYHYNIKDIEKIYPDESKSEINALKEEVEMLKLEVQNITKSIPNYFIKN